MRFSAGALVKTRGREWVVLPDSKDDFLLLRPLGGTDDEISGVLPALEPVVSAQFDLPDPTKPGDFRSSRLLRDALRLGFRTSAGPFRCYGGIAVAPRPYQLVPLLMALKLDPIRLMIADDVGIGKTIEASLIARELIDRGEVQRLAVLCPPHLAEQWQAELSSKFHINAQLVLPKTVASLERQLIGNQSIFDAFPHVIVSLDYIKSDRHRDEFLVRCPELVIVDEAHACAEGFGGRGGRHQRHKLIEGLTRDKSRHMIFVTATPHSGNEDAFRSLLMLLDPAFHTLPEDLSGDENRKHRERLAQHFVQRRRVDIERFLDADTPFPQRKDADETYSLHPDYKKLFGRVVEYAREIVLVDDAGAGEPQHRQRVRWWSALALLRSLGSSPAAAAATLRRRAVAADTQTVEEADELGTRAVLDLDGEGETDEIDMTPGSQLEAAGAKHETLLRLASEADKLKGAKDAKLQRVITLLSDLVKLGHHPIVFCRFIDTAEYVTEHLRAKLKDVDVQCVTGLLASEEREQRVNDMEKSPRRILVCTDCLSEGINLQKLFDSVVHYDLSWNPTRHEQREGRVDRYGQARKEVKVITYYGKDNEIDGLVLDVLLTKHRTIRRSLGISVPVPADTNQVLQTIIEGVLRLRAKDRRESAEQMLLPGMAEIIRPEREELFKKWDRAADSENKGRMTKYAQVRLAKYAEEVKEALDQVQAAIGSQRDVGAFLRDALRAHGVTCAFHGSDELHFDLSHAPAPVVEAARLKGKPHVARFQPPADEDQLLLTRTHPTVEGLASYVLDTALDSLGEGVARRCGAIYTDAVQKRTTLLLVRLRFHIMARRVTRRAAGTELTSEEQRLLAEDCAVLAFEGSVANAAWLTRKQAEALLDAEPKGSNVVPEMAQQRVGQVVEAYHALLPHLEEVARERGRELEAAHNRVREVTEATKVAATVEPQLPPDLLGVYVFLPAH